MICIFQRLFCVMMILSTLLFYVECACASDWPTIAYDNARTGCTVDSFGGPNLQEVWFKTYTDTEFATRTSAIIIGGVVYIGAYTGDFFALNLSDGLTKWQVKLGGPVINAACGENNIIYVPCMDRNVYALDAQNGTELWRFSADAGFCTGGCVENGVVYMGCLDGKFYAIQNGQKKWSYDVGVPIRNTAALKDGTVYFGGEDMRVYALNSTGGGLVWQSDQIIGNSFREYYPVVTDSLVILRTTPLAIHSEIALNPSSDFQNNPQHETAFAFNISNGNKPFEIPVLHTSGCGATSAPPVIGPDSTIYLIMGDVVGIVTMNPTNGNLNRLGDLGGAPRDETYTFAVSADDKIWVAHQDVFGYFDLNTNTSLWNTHASGDGNVGARDTSGGHNMAEWSRNAWHGPAQAPPAVYGDRIIWQTGSYIICVGPQN